MAGPGLNRAQLLQEFEHGGVECVARRLTPLDVVVVIGKVAIGVGGAVLALLLAAGMAGAFGGRR